MTQVGRGPACHKVCGATCRRPPVVETRTPRVLPVQSPEELVQAATLQGEKGQSVPPAQDRLDAHTSLLCTDRTGQDSRWEVWRGGDRGPTHLDSRNPGGASVNPPHLQEKLPSFPEADGPTLVSLAFLTSGLAGGGISRPV